MSALPVLSVSQLPKWTYCANDPLYRDNQRRPREEAIRFKKIAVNHSARVNYLIFDCDHDDDFRFRHVGLPSPSWIAASRETGRYHIAWRLSSPVLTGYGARRKPKWFLAGVTGAMREALNADPGYSGLLTKNPLLDGKNNWEVQPWKGDPITLQDMADRVGFNAKSCQRDAAINTGTALGRNCQLFDWLRHWAYQNLAYYPKQASWAQAVLRTAQELNTSFPYPLSEQEIAATAKSVARWVWNHYTAGKPKLTGDALRAAHQRGAQTAAKNRKAASDAKVLAIFKDLMATNAPVSVKRLARESGCDRRVARRVLASQS